MEEIYVGGKKQIHNAAEQIDLVASSRAKLSEGVRDAAARRSGAGVCVGGGDGTLTPTCCNNYK